MQSTFHREKKQSEERAAQHRKKQTNKQKATWNNMKKKTGEERERESKAESLISIENGFKETRRSCSTSQHFCFRNQKKKTSTRKKITVFGILLMQSQNCNIQNYTKYDDKNKTGW